MASSSAKKSRIVAAINSLGDDGVIVSPIKMKARTMSFEDIRSLVAFLQQYAEQHGILLPGRIPGYKNENVKLLPSNNSKRVRIYTMAYIVKPTITS